MAPRERGEYVPFTTDTENVELMQECSLKHLRVEAARMKEDNEIVENGKQKSQNGNNQSGHNRMKSQRPSYSSGLPSPQGSDYPKWMNYLANLTLHL